MSLPVTIDPTAPPDTQALGLGAARIQEIKGILIDVLGLPSGTSITLNSFTHSADGIPTMAAFDNTTGTGRKLIVGRNSNATTPAPGHIDLTMSDGTVVRVYIDSTGMPRMLTAADPTSANQGTGIPIGVPPGVVFPYAGSTEPVGFLFCGGQAVSRATYAALFAVISTTYGVGDGSTTFNLPDLRGRAVAGRDNMISDAGRLTLISGDTLGAAGGTDTVTLTTAQLAAHSHGVNDIGHTHNVSVGGASAGAGLATGTDSAQEPRVLSHTAGVTIQNTGSDSAHSNTQPTIVLNYIIKY